MAHTAWHMHHETLWEAVYGGIDERRERKAYIRLKKPLDEQKLRLSLFKWSKKNLQQLDREDILNAHTAECKDCPWDWMKEKETIFNYRDKKGNWCRPSQRARTRQPSRSKRRRRRPRCRRRRGGTLTGRS